MNKLTILIFIIIASLTSMSASTYNIEDVPNVHLQDRNRFVSDPDGLLTAEARNIVDKNFRALMDSTSAEAVVVLLQSIGDQDIVDFTQRLFDSWKVGKSDKDNGLLLLFVMDQRKVRIHTGYGMEGIIPDITAKQIIDRDIVPHMRNGDIDGAIVAASDRIMRICTNPEAKEEILSSQANDRPARSDNSGNLRTIFLLVVLISFAVTIVLFINTLMRGRGKTNYQKAEIIRNSLWMIAITSLLSLLSGAIFFLIALYLSKRYRNRPIKCDVCNTKMKKLSEDEDNQYLTPAQDREEQLKSVDYDVWLCPKCGETEVFPFKSKTSTFNECPYCHTYASTHIYDRIHHKPTVNMVGQGMHVYECKYCRKHHEVPYEIPKVVPVVPIIGGGGGNGGGFSGGSFGGGMSGGGGASGGW